MDTIFAPLLSGSPFLVPLVGVFLIDSPKHLGAHIGVTAVLHTWGSALTHHPHLHCIIPGGGLSLDGQHWVACKPGFFLPVRVLSRLFLEQLSAAHHTGLLQFFGAHQHLADPKDFANYLAPLRQIDWVVYAKRPFAGPEAVLAYLSRYTHRVAIANKVRSKHLARARELLQIPPEVSDDSVDIEPSTACVYLCKSCGAPMLIIETFYAAHAPRAPPIGQP